MPGLLHQADSGLKAVRQPPKRRWQPAGLRPSAERLYRWPYGLEHRQVSSQDEPSAVTVVAGYQSGRSAESKQRHPTNQQRGGHMAFIRYLSEAEQPVAYRVPDTDNILQIHGVHSEVMRQHYELYLELMHRPGPLTRQQRETLAVRVSALNGCHY
jgi:hypothetical protein